MQDRCRNQNGLIPTFFAGNPLNILPNPQDMRGIMRSIGRGVRDTLEEIVGKPFERGKVRWSKHINRLETSPKICNVVSAQIPGDQLRQVRVCAVPHSCSAFITGASALPFSVSRYSDRGGLAEY